MTRIDFCKNWTFTREGAAPRVLDLPHDAQMEETRGADMPSGSAGAYFAGGKYVYEKTFDDAGLSDKAVMLQFGGVYRKAEVFLNGERVSACAYGYAPFWADLTGRVREGENVLRVTADNSETPNSRWYSGAGIYRPVWLWTGERDHIVPEGVNVTTLSVDPARILVETEICGQGNVSVDILYNGSVVAAGNGASVELTIPDAHLWSAETPNLYTCRVSLVKDGVTVDTCEVPFGIRKLEWSTKGFFVNGVETNLRGGCVHHDNGILGAVTYYEAEERKVRLLKKWGFNAIRSAHNPASPYLLEACDRLGMYVMDEMWDMWYKTKTSHDYALDFEANWQCDIENTVRRDRVHPSVVLYSIGNEVTEPAEDRGNELARELVDAFHRLDPTRPTTVGLNLALVMMAKMGAGAFGGENRPREDFSNISSEDYNKLAMASGEHMNAASALPEVEAVSAKTLDAVDIAGYNYGQSRYPLECDEHPRRVIVGSETFPQNIASNWTMVEKYPYLIGDFMWTAWDYLGEAGIGAWVWDKSEFGFGKPYPWLLAEAGTLDILGDDTAEAGFAAAVFEKRLTPYIGVRPVNHPGVEPAVSTWRGTNAIPSWSWRGCEGNTATVEVYTAAREAELFLNGVSLGRKLVTDYLAAFELPYAPGELTAVTYENGAEAGRATLRSADSDLRLRIAPEGKPRTGRPCFIRVDITGGNGVVDSNADELLTVKITGGRLLRFGSACPKTECSYLTGTFPSHYGRSMAVVIPESNELTIHVHSASGLAAQATLDVEEETVC